MKNIVLIGKMCIRDSYYGMPREAVVALLLPGIIPFNLLRCV